MRQFHAIVVFRLKSICDLDSGSLPRFFVEFIYGVRKIKNYDVILKTGREIAKITLTNGKG